MGLEPESLRFQRDGSSASEWIKKGGGIANSRFHDLRAGCRKQAFIADVLPDYELLD
ncbi:hypothetical protein [Mycolicibacterium llatzerense]|uniref:hypothetical protein n=1 Tax=Mycolicibacterium llatzerense TaxID=280871 RepID=UPI0021B6B640|nr:hypothetical protein [Mycolicibacterium llatzerense]